MTVIGVDVGGTKIEAILFDGKKILKTVRVPTEADKKYSHVLQNIVQAIDLVRTPGVRAIGLGTPGYVHEGKLHACPNNKSLEGRSLARDVEKLTGLPVYHENDAKCFALAETRLGAAKGKKNVVGLVIGTGVGSGIIMDNQILRGAIGAAGEIGHAPYLHHDYEYYVCGPGLVRMYREAGGTFDRSSAQLMLAGKSAPDWRSIQSSREAHLDALARLVTTIIDTINPDVIVFGGGMSRSINFRNLRKRVQMYAFKPTLEATRLKPFALSDSAGSVGAALLALEAQSLRK